MSAETDVMAAESRVIRLRRVPWAEVGRVGLVAVQLAIILLLARAFQLEHASFHEVVLPLAFGGFLVHHWLPRRYQTWFFLALSLAGVVLVLGPVSGGWLIGIGLSL